MLLARGVSAFRNTILPAIPLTGPVLLLAAAGALAPPRAYGLNIVQETLVTARKGEEDSLFASFAVSKTDHDGYNRGRTWGLTIAYGIN